MLFVAPYYVKSFKVKSEIFSSWNKKLNQSINLWMMQTAGLMVALRKLDERTEPDRVKISGDGGKGGRCG